MSNKPPNDSFYPPIVRVDDAPAPPAGAVLPSSVHQSTVGGGSHVSVTTSRVDMQREQQSRSSSVAPVLVGVRAPRATSRRVREALLDFLQDRPSIVSVTTPLAERPSPLGSSSSLSPTSTLSVGQAFLLHVLGMVLTATIVIVCAISPSWPLLLICLWLWLAPRRLYSVDDDADDVDLSAALDVPAATVAPSLARYHGHAIWREVPATQFIKGLDSTSFFLVRALQLKAIMVWCVVYVVALVILQIVIVASPAAASVHRLHATTHLSIDFFITSLYDNVTGVTTPAWPLFSPLPPYFAIAGLFDSRSQTFEFFAALLGHVMVFVISLVIFTSTPRPLRSRHLGVQRVLDPATLRKSRRPWFLISDDPSDEMAVSDALDDVNHRNRAGDDDAGSTILLPHEAERKSGIRFGPEVLLTVNCTTNGPSSNEPTMAPTPQADRTASAATTTTTRHLQWYLILVNAQMASAVAIGAAIVFPTLGSMLLATAAIASVITCFADPPRPLDARESLAKSVDAHTKRDANDAAPLPPLMGPARQRITVLRHPPSWLRGNAGSAVRSLTIAGMYYGSVLILWAALLCQSPYVAFLTRSEPEVRSIMRAVGVLNARSCPREDADAMSGGEDEDVAATQSILTSAASTILRHVATSGKASSAEGYFAEGHLYMGASAYLDRDHLDVSQVAWTRAVNSHWQRNETVRRWLSLYAWCGTDTLSASFVSPTVVIPIATETNATSATMTSYALPALSRPLTYLREAQDRYYGRVAPLPATPLAKRHTKTFASTVVSGEGNASPLAAPFDLVDNVDIGVSYRIHLFLLLLLLLASRTTGCSLYRLSPAPRSPPRVDDVQASDRSKRGDAPGERRPRRPGNRGEGRTVPVITSEAVAPVDLQPVGSVGSRACFTAPKPEMSTGEVAAMTAARFQILVVGKLINAVYTRSHICVPLFGLIATALSPTVWLVGPLVYYSTLPLQVFRSGMESAGPAAILARRRQMRVLGRLVFAVEVIYLLTALMSQIFLSQGPLLLFAFGMLRDASNFFTLPSLVIDTTTISDNTDWVNRASPLVSLVPWDGTFRLLRMLTIGGSFTTRESVHLGVMPIAVRWLFHLVTILSLVSHDLQLRQQEAGDEPLRLLHRVRRRERHDDATENSRGGTSSIKPTDGGEPYAEEPEAHDSVPAVTPIVPNEAPAVSDVTKTHSEDLILRRVVAVRAAHSAITIVTLREIREFYDSRSTLLMSYDAPPAPPRNSNFAAPRGDQLGSFSTLSEESVPTDDFFRILLPRFMGGATLNAAEQALVMQYLRIHYPRRAYDRALPLLVRRPHDDTEDAMPRGLRVGSRVVIGGLSENGSTGGHGDVVGSGLPPDVNADESRRRLGFNALHTLNLDDCLLIIQLFRQHGSINIDGLVDPGDLPDASSSGPPVPAPSSPNDAAVPSILVTSDSTSAALPASSAATASQFVALLMQQSSEVPSDGSDDDDADDDQRHQPNDKTVTINARGRAERTAVESDDKLATRTVILAADGVETSDSAPQRPPPSRQVLERRPPARPRAVDPWNDHVFGGRHRSEAFEECIREDGSANGSRNANAMSFGSFHLYDLQATMQGADPGARGSRSSRNRHPRRSTAPARSRDPAALPSGLYREARGSVIRQPSSGLLLALGDEAPPASSSVSDASSDDHPTDDHAAPAHASPARNSRGTRASPLTALGQVLRRASRYLVWLYHVYLEMMYYWLMQNGITVAVFCIIAAHYRSHSTILSAVLTVVCLPLVWIPALGGIVPRLTSLRAQRAALCIVLTLAVGVLVGVYASHAVLDVFNLLLVNAVDSPDIPAAGRFTASSTASGRSSSDAAQSLQWLQHWLAVAGFWGYESTSLEVLVYAAIVLALTAQYSIAVRTLDVQLAAEKGSAPTSHLASRDLELLSSRQRSLRAALEELRKEAAAVTDAPNITEPTAGEDPDTEPPVELRRGPRLRRLARRMMRHVEAHFASLNPTTGHQFTVSWEVIQARVRRRLSLESTFFAQVQSFVVLVALAGFFLGFGGLTSPSLTALVLVVFFLAQAMILALDPDCVTRRSIALAWIGIGVYASLLLLYGCATSVIRVDEFALQNAWDRGAMRVGDRNADPYISECYARSVARWPRMDNETKTTTADALALRRCWRELGALFSLQSPLQPTSPMFLSALALQPIDLLTVEVEIRANATTTATTKSAGDTLPSASTSRAFTPLAQLAPLFAFIFAVVVQGSLLQGLCDSIVHNAERTPAVEAKTPPAGSGGGLAGEEEERRSTTVVARSEQQSETALRLRLAVLAVLRFVTVHADRLCWLSCYVASLRAQSLIDVAYIVFFIADMKGVVPLVYSIAHLLLAYVYGLSVFPAHTGRTEWDQFIFGSAAAIGGSGGASGLSASTAVAVTFGPLFVFFSVLFRKSALSMSARLPEMTAQASAELQRIQLRRRAQSLRRQQHHQHVGGPSQGSTSAKDDHRQGAVNEGEPRSRIGTALELLGKALWHHVSETADYLMNHGIVDFGFELLLFVLLIAIVYSQRRLVAAVHVIALIAAVARTKWNCVLGSRLPLRISLGVYYVILLFFATTGLDIVSVALPAEGRNASRDYSSLGRNPETRNLTLELFGSDPLRRAPGLALTGSTTATATLLIPAEIVSALTTGTVDVNSTIPPLTTASDAAESATVTARAPAGSTLSSDGITTVADAAYYLGARPTVELTFPIFLIVLVLRALVSNDARAATTAGDTFEAAYARHCAGERTILGLTFLGATNALQYFDRVLRHNPAAAFRLVQAFFELDRAFVTPIAGASTRTDPDWDGSRSPLVRPQRAVDLIPYVFCNFYVTPLLIAIDSITMMGGPGGASLLSLAEMALCVYLYARQPRVHWRGAFAVWPRVWLACVALLIIALMLNTPWLASAIPKQPSVFVILGFAHFDAATSGGSSRLSSAGLVTLAELNSATSALTSTLQPFSLTWIRAIAVFFVILQQRMVDSFAYFEWLRNKKVREALSAAYRSRLNDLEIAQEARAMRIVEKREAEQRFALAQAFLGMVAAVSQRKPLPAAGNDRKTESSAAADDADERPLWILAEERLIAFVNGLIRVLQSNTWTLVKDDINLEDAESGPAPADDGADPQDEAALMPFSIVSAPPSPVQSDVDKGNDLAGALLRACRNVLASGSVVLLTLLVCALLASTGTLVNAVPALGFLVYANLWWPWPHRWFWKHSITYFAVTLIIKMSIVFMAVVGLATSPTASAFVSVMFVNVRPDTVSASPQTDMLLSVFLLHALLIYLLQHADHFGRYVVFDVALTEQWGVSVDGEADDDSSTDPDESDADDDDDDRSAEEMARERERREAAKKRKKQKKKEQADAEEDADDEEADSDVTLNLILAATPREKELDHLDAPSSASAVNRCGAPPGPSAAVASKSPPSHAAVLLQQLHATHFSGIDVYTAHVSIEFIALVYAAATYFTLAGRQAGSFLSAVQQSLLPGPMVIMILLLALIMVVDRATYVAASAYPIAAVNIKAATHAVLCLFYLLTFVVWVATTSTPDAGAGSVLLMLKVAAMILSAQQVRRGYPVLRRHDPFTWSSDKVYAVLYSIYRLVPFLWDLRVMLDWTFSRTALKLQDFLKVEDIAHNVYSRYADITGGANDHPKRGVAVDLLNKLFNGVILSLAILALLFAPLLYYSAFNPSLQPNTVASASFGVALGPYATLYETTTADGGVSARADVAQQLTRLLSPELSAIEYGSTDRDVQLLELSRCAKSTWGVSPSTRAALVAHLSSIVVHGQRQVLTAIAPTSNATAGGGAIPDGTQTLLTLPADLFLNQELVVNRLHGGGGSTPTQVLRQALQVDAFLASAMLQVMGEAPLSSALEPLWLSPPASAGSATIEYLFDPILLNLPTIVQTVSEAVNRPEPHRRSPRSRPGTPFGLWLAAAERQFGKTLASTTAWTPVVPDPTATLSAAGLTNVVCSLSLQSEQDRNLGNATVQSWCTQCQPIFTNANSVPTVPPSLSSATDEQACIYSGKRCPSARQKYLNRAASVSPYVVVSSDRVPVSDSTQGIVPLEGGIVVLYTTFIVALGNLIRSTLTGMSQNIVLSDVHNPRCLALLIGLIYYARVRRETVEGAAATAAPEPSSSSIGIPSPESVTSTAVAAVESGPPDTAAAADAIDAGAEGPQTPPVARPPDGVDAAAWGTAFSWASRVKNLVAEEQLFLQLVDLLRAPEELKARTGNRLDTYDSGGTLVPVDTRRAL